MNTSFLDAMVIWNQNRQKYINGRLPPVNEKTAPRKNIFITIPLEFEDEIKAYVKAKRKESDVNLTKNLEIQKVKLSIEFESENPAPHVMDF